MVFVGLSLKLGLFVLGVGLIFTRAVPRWVGIAIEVAAVVLVGGLFNNPIGAVGAAMLLSWPGRNRSASTQAVLSTHARISLG